MPLPRFNSGRMGTLEWSHLNEAFDLIEKPEATQPKSGNPYRIGTSFLVQATSSTGSGTTAKTAFKEVAASSIVLGTFVDVSGGVNSTDGDDAFKTPILGAALPAGSIATVLSHIAQDGSLYFRVSGSVATTGTAFMGIVVQSFPLQTGKSWTYEILQNAELNTLTVVWTGSGTVYAYNGCENPLDGASIGVGTIPPTGVTYARQAIKNGTVVSCLTVNSKYYFSIPNGYSFVCI